MSGIRKTPYKHGNRCGPDIAERVRQYPHLCRVHYRGNWYRWATCNSRTCRKKYWHRYRSHPQGNTLFLQKYTYCSDQCSLEEQKKLCYERQARWRRRNPEVWKAIQERVRERAKQRRRLQKQKPSSQRGGANRWRS